MSDTEDLQLKHGVGDMLFNGYVTP